MPTITVHLSYKGYIAVRAGCPEERLTLPQGAGCAEVMDHIAARCGLGPDERRHLFLSVSNPGTGGEVLEDGDRIAVGILVGGG